MYERAINNVSHCLFWRSFGTDKASCLPRQTAQHWLPHVCLM